MESLQSFDIKERLHAYEYYDVNSMRSGHGHGHPSKKNTCRYAAKAGMVTYSNWIQDYKHILNI